MWQLQFFFLPVLILICLLNLKMRSVLVMILYNFKYESFLSNENSAVTRDPDFDKHCLQLFQSMKKTPVLNQTQVKSCKVFYKIF